MVLHLCVQYIQVMFHQSVQYIYEVRASAKHAIFSSDASGRARNTFKQYLCGASSMHVLYSKVLHRCMQYVQGMFDQTMQYRQVICQCAYVFAWCCAICSRCISSKRVQQIQVVLHQSVQCILVMFCLSAQSSTFK
jgi:hypothetical protein